MTFCAALSLPNNTELILKKNDFSRNMSIFASAILELPASAKCPADTACFGGSKTALFLEKSFNFNIKENTMEEKRFGQLTNEQISKRFRSQFDLVNHAIRMAGHLIHSGHAPSPGSADNIVNDVLIDIKLGRDYYLDEEEEEEEVDEVVIFSTEDEEEETKKGRSRAVAKR